MRKRPGTTACVAGLSLLFVLAATSFSFAGIYIEPYLQNPQSDGMSVLWWTDSSEATSQVEYGLGGYGSTVTASNTYVSSMGKYLHEVTLSGLGQQQTYDYRVRSGSNLSDTYTFSTAKLRSSNFRVGILGDGQTDDASTLARHRTVLNQAADRGSDLIFEAGDMVQDGSTGHWGDLFRKVLTSSSSSSTVASRIPFHTMVGNHEIYEGTWGASADGNLTTTMARYKALQSNPANGSVNSNWEERYYTVKYGVATFIVLDINNTSNNTHDNHSYLNDGTTPDWEPGSEQYDWMVSELEKAQEDGAFTFVMGHPSPYSRGVHGDPNDSQRGIELRVLDPIFRQYGVDAVLVSHDHMVERSLTGPAGYESEMDETDPDNLNYITMGNSGDSSRDADPGWESWMDITGNNGAPYYTKYFYDWAGDDTKASSLDINFVNQLDGTWQADFQIVRNDGNTYDPFSLVRSEAKGADLDDDGDVDGADFLAWQRGGSPDPFSAEDLALWKEQFGATGPPPSAASAAVPEPSSSILLLAAFACCLPSFARRLGPRD